MSTYKAYLLKKNSWTFSWITASAWYSNKDWVTNFSRGDTRGRDSLGTLLQRRTSRTKPVQLTWEGEHGCPTLDIPSPCARAARAMITLPLVSTGQDSTPRTDYIPVWRGRPQNASPYLDRMLQIHKGSCHTTSPMPRRFHQVSHIESHCVRFHTTQRTPMTPQSPLTTMWTPSFFSHSERQHVLTASLLPAHFEVCSYYLIYNFWFLHHFLFPCCPLLYIY